jgi:hypothetical protein
LILQKGFAWPCRAPGPGLNFQKTFLDLNTGDPINPIFEFWGSAAGWVRLVAGAALA